MALLAKIFTPYRFAIQAKNFLDRASNPPWLLCFSAKSFIWKHFFDFDQHFCFLFLKILAKYINIKNDIYI